MQRLVPRGREEIEETHIVGAGVRAIARADAAIVDLRVEAFFRMGTRIRGADGLARRVVALLAKYGTELDLDIREFSFPVAFDANPVHGAAARRFGVADSRNVVFGMARHDAGFAARAAIEIHGHSPVMRHAPFFLYRVLRMLPHSAGEQNQFRFGLLNFRHANARGGPCEGAGFRVRSIGARMEMGFAPRPLAKRVNVSCPCPIGIAIMFGAMPGESAAGNLNLSLTRRDLDDIALQRVRVPLRFSD